MQGLHLTIVIVAYPIEIKEHKRELNMVNPARSVKHDGLYIAHIIITHNYVHRSHNKG